MQKDKKTVMQNSDSTEQDHGLQRNSRIIRILLAEDHMIIREGLAAILKGHAGLEVVAQASNGLEAVDLAMQLNPDVILMDISMPRMDGIEATALIHQKKPGIRIIGLSMYDDTGMQEKIMKAGASGYIDKAAPPLKLVKAIRQIA